MALPPILMAGAVQPIGAAEDLVAASPAGPSIEFTIQQQAVDQWCWAAVAVSVALTYDLGTRWSQQCLLANDLFTQQTCCDDPSSQACNQQARLEDALSKTGHLDQGPIPPIPFDQVKSELVAQKLVCLRIQTDGVGHFVVISGCSDDSGDQRLDLHDPQGIPDSNLSFDEVMSRYNGNGVCTDAYLTR